MLTTVRNILRFSTNIFNNFRENSRRRQAFLCRG